MSRKNAMIAGLITAAFTIAVFTYTLRPDGGPALKQASVPNPHQEKTIKKTALTQDVSPTDRLNRTCPLNTPNAAK
ncbi:hypothetical protein AMQ83_10810, partial [Paenibacillus riograndensis]